MMAIANLIKNKLSLLNFAEGLYGLNYKSLWNRPMYNMNNVFLQLKDKYKKIPLNRQTIINLFKEEKYYDAFLCAMIWGGIGSNVTGKEIFNSVFSEDNQASICEKIERVVQIIKDESKEPEDRIQIAYLSLADKDKNGIEGIGESFYTKILYFAGAGIESLTLKPLIYDRNMRDAYKLLMNRLNLPEIKEPLEQYIDYCRKMEELRDLLNFLSSDQVEALLFQPVIRRVFFDEGVQNNVESLN